VRDVSRLLGGDAGLLARFNMFAPPGHAVFPEAAAAPPPAPPPSWAEAAGDVAIALTRREARRGTRARRAQGLRVMLGRSSLGPPSTRGRFLRNARAEARRSPRRRGRAPRARADVRVRGDAAPRGGARARRRRRLRRREPRDAGLPRPRRRALRGVAGRRADADPFYPTSTRAYANGFDARLAAVLRALDERHRFVPKSAESTSTRPRVPKFGGDRPNRRLASSLPSMPPRAAAHWHPRRPLAAALENSPFAEYQVSAEAFRAGQEKRAKFPTSKAPISAVFHSFRLIFGRAIISRNGLEAWMLFLERARAEHSC